MLAIIARPLLASKFTPCMYSIELLRFVNANYQILTTVSYTFWTPSKYTTLTYNSNKLPRYFWLHSYKSQSFFFTDFAAGLRPRYDPVRMSQNRLSSAISGGFSSVGGLMTKSYEDLHKAGETKSNIGRSGVCFCH